MVRRNFPRRGTLRSASTILEVLVVIAIGVILLGVLLPAVLKAREASHRLQCANNLKQIGLGCHGHLDTVGVFPSAGRYWGSARVKNGGEPALGPAQDWSWAYQVLPFVGQE